MDVLSLAAEVLEGDFSKATALISVLLSYAIVAGSFTLKVPQIIKILQSNSVRGISLEMLVMELIGYLICASYNYGHGYPLSTYAENCVIFLQNVVLIALFVSFKKALGLKLLAGTVLVCLWIGLILNEAVPRSVDVFLMTFVNIPLFAASRVPQIYKNFQAKSTGVLAVTGFILAFGGNLARIFTTLTGSGDPVILAGFCINAGLNFIIIVQAFLYGDAEAKQRKTE